MWASISFENSGHHASVYVWQVGRQADLAAVQEEFPALDPELAEPEGLGVLVVKAGALGLELERVEVRLAEIPEASGPPTSMRATVSASCFRPAWPRLGTASPRCRRRRRVWPRIAPAPAADRAGHLDLQLQLFLARRGLHEDVAEWAPRGRLETITSPINPVDSRAAARVTTRPGSRNISVRSFGGRDHLDPEHGVLAGLHGLADVHFAGRPGDAAAFRAVDVNDRVRAHPLQGRGSRLDPPSARGS